MSAVLSSTLPFPDPLSPGCSPKGPRRRTRLAVPRSAPSRSRLPAPPPPLWRGCAAAPGGAASRVSCCRIRRDTVSYGTMSHVMSRHVTSRHVMSCHVMSCDARLIFECVYLGRTGDREVNTAFVGFVLHRACACHVYVCTCVFVDMCLSRHVIQGLPPSSGGKRSPWKSESARVEPPSLSSLSPRTRVQAASITEPPRGAGGPVGGPRSPKELICLCVYIYIYIYIHT